jgi:hypothetical protein
MAALNVNLSCKAPAFKRDVLGRIARHWRSDNDEAMIGIA